MPDRCIDFTDLRAARVFEQSLWLDAMARQAKRYGRTGDCAKFAERARQARARAWIIERGEVPTDRPP